MQPSPIGRRSRLAGRRKEGPEHLYSPDPRPFLTLIGGLCVRDWNVCRVSLCSRAWLGFERGYICTLQYLQHTGSK